MSQFLSPLRYPGGKRKLSNFVKLVFRINGLVGGVYIEPYAGGAAIALSLLFGEYASRIIINDLDPSIYSFWKAVLENPAELCHRIKRVEVNVEEWERQREIQDSENPDMMDLAFSTFFLNRTNRSGIIRAGIIGGKSQDGEWKIDVRFNRDDLVQRIEKISRYSSRIRLYNLDAAVLISEVMPILNTNSLIYLDPPYYAKGGDLYQNYYIPSDHKVISELIKSANTPWIVTYDNVQPICELYDGVPSLNYRINYSAQDRYKGAEVMFYSALLSVPDVEDPARIRRSDVNALQREMQV